MEQILATAVTGALTAIATWVAVAAYLRAIRKESQEAEVKRAVQAAELAAGMKSLAESVNNITESNKTLAERQLEHATEQTQMVLEMRERLSGAERSIDHLRSDVSEIRKVLQQAVYVDQPVIPPARRAGAR
jgi:hypothetical protein